MTPEAKRLIDLLLESAHPDGQTWAANEDIHHGGHTIQVWEDFEVTCQKSGGLLWQRSLHQYAPPLSILTLGDVASIKNELARLHQMGDARITRVKDHYCIWLKPEINDMGLIERAVQVYKPEFQLEALAGS